MKTSKPWAQTCLADDLSCLIQRYKRFHETDMHAAAPRDIGKMAMVYDLCTSRTGDRSHDERKTSSTNFFAANDYIKHTGPDPRNFTPTTCTSSRPTYTVCCGMFHVFAYLYLPAARCTSRCVPPSV